MAVPAMGARALVELLAYVIAGWTMLSFTAVIVARFVAELGSQESTVSVGVGPGDGGDDEAVVLLCLKWMDLGGVGSRLLVSDLSPVRGI